MDHIRLPSPYRRDVERCPQEYQYTTESPLYLPRPEDSRARESFDVLNDRRSRREGGQPSAVDVSSLLWHCAKTRGTSTEESGFLWQHRASPSGGGRHPIDIVLGNYQGDASGLYLYDPLAHTLARLSNVDAHQLRTFVDTVNQVLSVGQAVIIWFVAQFDRTLSKYADGESLVWLDAGAMLATFYLVAEASSLNWCAIGITGEPWISGLLKARQLVEGVGGCLLWTRENP